MELSSAVMGYRGFDVSCSRGKKVGPIPKVCAQHHQSTCPTSRRCSMLGFHQYSIQCSTPVSISCHRTATLYAITSLQSHPLLYKYLNVIMSNVTTNRTPTIHLKRGKPSKLAQGHECSNLELVVRSRKFDTQILGLLGSRDSVEGTLVNSRSISVCKIM
ncbi:hypothetical protein AUEXF2481DRAFT_43932 [Aureobasidium subglaciale EXF-2481]|uniref:Uncharacterized protein n=1 Tax=Aureobasidium subglaciale (strain EXF-2481) TaxID=1043005 RepID=A0A074Y1E0_AURSE|nr:uncharacterized protein AUEXF2481DRAFT_43932 [Aureobasidium subglaciale EXF-2481]KEQ91545.1 hypothetical protein AUEXF2481DRAFT_43932 [Aureobasidium subglaciale EXF-2481]